MWRKGLVFVVVAGGGVVEIRRLEGVSSGRKGVVMGCRLPVYGEDVVRRWGSRGCE